MGWIFDSRDARAGDGLAKPAARCSTGPKRNLEPTPIWAIIAPANEPSLKLAEQARLRARSTRRSITTSRPWCCSAPGLELDLPAAAAAAAAAAARRSAAARAAARARRGRGRADRARSDEPTLSTKPVGLFHGLLRARIPGKALLRPAPRPRRARRRSGRPSGSRRRARSRRADSARTARACPRAASCGRAARLGDRQILLEAGDMVEDRAALARSAPTSTRRRKSPAAGRAAGRTSGSHQPLFSAVGEASGMPSDEGDRRARRSRPATAGICRPPNSWNASHSKRRGDQRAEHDPDLPDRGRRRRRNDRGAGQPQRGEEQKQRRPPPSHSCA